MGSLFCIQFLSNKTCDASLPGNSFTGLSLHCCMSEERSLLSLKPRELQHSTSKCHTVQHFDTTVIGQWSEQGFHSFLSDLCGLPFASSSTVWWPGTSTARSGPPPEREGDSGTSCGTACRSPAPPRTRTNVWTETPRHGESTSAPAGSPQASSTWRRPRRSATDRWRSRERRCWPRSTDPRRCRHRGWSAPSWRRCEAWVCRGQGEGSGHAWPRNWWQMCRSRGCAQVEPHAVGHHPQCRNWKKKLYFNSTKHQLTF